MKNLPLYALLLIILGTSCTDEQILNRKERRLTGTWKIERAKFRENWALFNDDVLGFYDGDHITFYDDYFAAYEDNSLRAVFDGDWAIILDRDPEDDCDLFVDMAFYDYVNDETFSYFGEITFLTHNKMKITVVTPDGRYRFKFLKQ